MPVDNRGTATVFGRPVIANWQAELVRLARGLAIEGEVPDPAGSAPLHLLAQPGVRDHELAVVQHIVADQAVEERHGALFESRGLLAQLPERLRQTMRHLHIPALQGADELLLMVPRHAKCSAGGNRAHHQPQHARRVGAAVDQVAEKDQLPAWRRRDPVLRAIRAMALDADVIPQPAE